MDRYWVGGTGTWDLASTTHWAASSGGASGASVPTSGDAVYFDSNSGAGTVTLGANVVGDVVFFEGAMNISGATYSPTFTNIAAVSGSARTLSLGTGTWTLTATGGANSMYLTDSNLTVSGASATVKCTGSNHISYLLTGTIGTYWVSSSTVSLLSCATPVFGTLKLTSGGSAMSFTVASVYGPVPLITISSLVTTGFGAGNKLNWSSVGQHTLYSTSGTHTLGYTILRNSDATGGATFIADSTCTDGGGNSGWTFQTASPGRGLFAACNF